MDPVLEKENNKPGKESMYNRLISPGAKKLFQNHVLRRLQDLCDVKDDDEVSLHHEFSSSTTLSDEHCTKD